MNASNTRESVLGSIRGSLRVTGDDAARVDAVRKRLKAPSPNLVPERANVRGEESIALLTEMLEGQSAHVSRAKTLDEIPKLVANYLRKNNLPAEFRTGSDGLLADIPWGKATSLTHHLGRGQGDDAVAVSRARTAAAETGTLFLTSGPENPTTLNFLPDTHIVVIQAKDILGSYEDGWNAIRKIYGKRPLPRAVNLISGPSRTADIEQIIVMGAHGPRRLHVIIAG